METQIKGTNAWQKHGKDRLYFQNNYLGKARAYYTEDEKDQNGRYAFPFHNGAIVAGKCYNGCVQREIENLEIIEPEIITKKITIKGF